MSYRVGFFLFSTLVFFACKKSDDPSLNEERTLLLLNKKWQLISLTQDWIGDNGTPVHMNHNSLLADHQRDNYLVFFSDNTFEVNDNILKDPEWPENPVTGKWQLSKDGKEFTQEYDEINTITFTWEVVSLTSAELKLRNIAGGVTNVNTYNAIQ